MKGKIILAIAFLLFSGNISRCFAYTNLPQNKALVRALNKQTGRTRDIEIAVGDAELFENIIIQVKACYSRPEDETPENSLFVIVNETNTPYKNSATIEDTGNLVFSGWMFSSSPSLSAMEHPNYDIWILECKNDPRLPKIEMPEIIKQTSNEIDAIPTIPNNNM